MRGRGDLVETRMRRAAAAARLWPEAVHYGRVPAEELPDVAVRVTVGVANLGGSPRAPRSPCRRRLFQAVLGEAGDALVGAELRERREDVEVLPRNLGGRPGG